MRLYRAVDGPRRFELDTVLLAGEPFHDPTLLHDDAGWWLFVEVSDGEPFDTLRLYHAGDLRGPWTEHPDSPVVDRDARIARPGGPVLVRGERRDRITQDGEGDYGLGLHAVPITTLTRERYAEGEPVPLGQPHGTGWAARGIHHLHAVQRPDGAWRVAFDGR